MTRSLCRAGGSRVGGPAGTGSPRQGLLARAGLLLLASALLAPPLAGCRGERTDAPPRQFFPDMDHQRKWDPQEPTGFFADGRTARATPTHAVAFASADFDPIAHAASPWAASYLAERDAMLAADDSVYRGVEILDDGTEAYLDHIPVQVTREMIEHGRAKFNIYCAACHGYAGDGKGMVGLKWYAMPANLTGEAYRDRANRQGKDGYLFHTILNGVWAPDGANRMPGYAHALDEMDAWAVVAYVRALQKSRGSSWAELSPEDQQSLGAPTPPAAPADNAAANGGNS